MDGMQATNDNDWPDDGLTPSMACDHCGKVRLVQFHEDPYAREIDGEMTEETYWCRECYQSRVEAI